ncbi:hypothetical protein J2S66_001093 [Saccharothrix longispora]|uniref:Uncharacterized protein n=1 Tax=Saccharothrix longispora TaxID=33920 RepID=A0ABU1PS12_9PSEU|nr:hypothetical protein [Saccharothrix longispora]
MNEVVIAPARPARTTGCRRHLGRSAPGLPL